MTARRNDNGDMEIVKWGLSNITFRGAMMLILVSLTPFGDRIWERLGMPKNQPETEGIARMERNIKTARAEVADLHEDVDTLAKKFGVFDADFKKYRVTHP